MLQSKSKLSKDKINKIICLCLFLATLLISGCTTEADIKRDQMIKSLSIQMVQNQRLSSDTTLQLHDIKQRLGMLTGEVEERGHQISVDQGNKTKEFQGQLDILKTQIDEQSREIATLQNVVSEQKEYLSKVLSSLSSLNKTATDNSLSPYDKAMNDYKNKQYAKAGPALLALLSDKSVTGKRLARVYHNLGMIAYSDGKFENAKTYFSKLITQFPKVSYNANGLLFLARSFQKTSQENEAKQTYNMIIEQYPKTDSAKSAQADLKKLK